MRTVHCRPQESSPKFQGFVLIRTNELSVFKFLIEKNFVWTIDQICNFLETATEKKTTGLVHNKIHPLFSNLIQFAFLLCSDPIYFFVFKNSPINFQNQLNVT